MNVTMSTSLIPQSLLNAQRDLDYLSSLSSSSVIISPAVLNGSTNSLPSSASIHASSAASATTTSRLVNPDTTTTIDPPATASDLRRLELAMRDVTELNERVMAQNISLMGDLEAAQRTVRELRAGKDALATQLKRLLLAQEAAVVAK